MDKINFGIIGAGLWGEAHAEVYSTHHSARLAAVCDINEEKAQRMASKYGSPKIYRQYQDLVNDPEIDAVAVVTPDFAHCDPVVAAARAGKHVITEKPLATTDEDLIKIESEIGKTNITFMVDFHNRWNPPIAITKKNIEEGSLGDIISGYFRLNDTISVPIDMLSWAEKSSILWFLGSHAVDTLRYFFDDEVERVYSVSRSEVLKKRGIDAPDIYQSVLEFKTGIIATIENNWIVPNTNPFVNDFKLNILGSKGMINIDMSNNQLIERFLEEKSDHPDCLVKPFVHDKHMGFAYESIREFVDCLTTGKEVKTGLEDGIRVSKVILAIMESAKNRQPVQVRY